MKKKLILPAVLLLCLLVSCAQADIKGRLDSDGSQMLMLWQPRSAKYLYQHYDSMSGDGEFRNLKENYIIRTHYGMAVVMGLGAEEAFGTTADAVWAEISEKIPQEIRSCVSQIQFIDDGDDQQYVWQTLLRNPRPNGKAYYLHLDHKRSKDNRLIYYNYGGYSFDEVADDITLCYVRYGLPEKERGTLLAGYRERFADDSPYLVEETALVKMLRDKYGY